jgi:YD repeat-containing protein
VAVASASALAVAFGIAAGHSSAAPSAERSRGAEWGALDRATTLAGRSELPALRTRFSRTYELADGTRELRVARTPVNHRDASGRWRPIDEVLRHRADGQVVSGAGALDATLPAAADEPVRVEHGGHALEFALAGARDTPVRASKRSAVYRGARPQVDVTYEVDGTSLKETLLLRSADAAGTHSYDVHHPGLRARKLASGAIAFQDDGGRTAFSFAAPWMQDAAGALSRAVRYEIRAQDGGRSTIAVVADRDWLDAPQRRFPVAVDPTVSAWPDGTCQIVSGFAANVSDCGYDTPLWIGRNGAQVHRGLVWIDPADELARDAVVLQAYVQTELEAQSAPEAAQVKLHWLTRAFGPGATWNAAEPGAPWTTPGGDFAVAAEASRWLRPSEVGDLVQFGVPALAQDQLDETRAVNGVVLKASDESRQHVDVLDDFELVIRYHERTGYDTRGYSFDTYDLSDGSDVSVNLGNGNLIAYADDLGFDAYDGRLPLGRFWNSLESGGFDGLYGEESRGDISSIMLEEHWVDDSFVYYGPGATDGVFVRRADGSYAPPAGLPATLTVNPDDTLTLRFADTGETWAFGSGPQHWLVRATDGDGYSIDVDYDEGRVSDSQGRHETWSYGPGGELTVTDDAARSRTYTFDGDGNLSSHRDPGGALTRYGYDVDERLTRIDLPDGRALTIAYDAAWRVAEVAELDDQGVETSETTYDYGGATPACRFRETAVERASGTDRYCHDWRLRLVDHSPPPPPSGFVAYVDDDPFVSAIVAWDQGEDTAGAADRPGSGVVRWHYRWKPSSSSTWGAWADTADNRFEIAGASLGGVYDVEVTAEDARGNVSTAAAYTVTVVPISELYDGSALDDGLDGANDAVISEDGPPPGLLQELPTNYRQNCHIQDRRTNMYFWTKTLEFDGHPVLQYSWSFKRPIATAIAIARPGLKFWWGIDVYVNGRNQGGPHYLPSEGKGPRYELHGSLAKIHKVSKRRPARKLRYGDRARYLGLSTAIDGNYAVIGRLDIGCTVRDVS